jgi:NADP-dependent 3-hydroxy acid dehydrogenase YdfG
MTFSIPPRQRIDVVVNNAGINQANLLRAVSADSAMNPMNTNFAGVIRVNQKVLAVPGIILQSHAHAPQVIPSMIESGR